MLKRSLSSIALRKIVEEARILEGAHFRKAYQLDYGTLALRFAIRRSSLEGFSEENPLAGELLGEGTADETDGISLGEGGGNYVRFDLFVKMGGYIFFSPKVDAEMPAEPSPFAMKLRKALKNRTLRSITQLELDRIAVLTFDPPRGSEDEIRLYLELFGDGNAILVRGGRIEHAFTSRTWSSRTVKRGEVFSPPPAGPDPFKLTRDEFIRTADGFEEDLVRFLIRKINLPPIYAEEVCFRASIDKRSPMGSMDGPTLDRVHAVFNDVLVAVEEQKGCMVHFQKGDPTLIEPLFMSSVFGMKDIPGAMSRFSKKKAGEGGNYFLELPSINQAVESFMFENVAPLPKNERSKGRGAERLEKLLKSQEKAMREREGETERYRLLADALYMDYRRVEGILGSFDPALYTEDPSRFPDIVSFDPDRRGGGTITLNVNTERGEDVVKLRIDRDVNGNAELLYEMSKKARRKLEGIRKAMESTVKKIEMARKEEERDSENEERERNRLRRFWFENFRWCFSSEGVLMVAGRDARSNEKLVKKYLRDSDIYAHADISGAASVVIRIEKEDSPTEVTFREGCHLSALHSKAWNAGIGSVGAFWVTSDQVSRTPSSGEFVARGSFVIRGKKNMVSKLPLEGAAGMVYVEGVPKVMFGPEEAVRENCKGPYFRIRPGRRSKTDMVKLVSSELGGEMDQIMSVLPAGDMEVEKVERTSE